MSESPNMTDEPAQDEQTKQPELWAPEVIESCCLALVEQRPDAARFSGAVVERCQELVGAVIEARLGGMPVRVVAARWKLSPQTVSGIMHRAESSGRIVSFARRIEAKIRRNVEAGLDEWYDQLAEGKVNSGQIPLAVCVQLDKLGPLMDLVSRALAQKDAAVPRHELEVKVAELRKRLATARPSDRQDAIDIGGEARSDVSAVSPATQLPVAAVPESANLVPESTLESTVGAEAVSVPGPAASEPASQPPRPRECDPPASLRRPAPAPACAPARAPEGGGGAARRGDPRGDGLPVEIPGSKEPHPENSTISKAQ